MAKNRAGLIVHRHIIKQDRVDEMIDGKFDKEPWGKKIPQPLILSDGTRKWTFS